MSADIAEPEPQRPPEWPATLDVDALVEGGWRPRPFQQFLLKVHSRCNLACDYCYVYTMADQSWRSRPMVMPMSLVAVAARRIAEHARAHGLTSVRIILHGGEPLLAGGRYLSEAVNAVRAVCAPDVRVEAAVQTNGVLLDEDVLRLFGELDLRVGVSLDGGRRDNDRHRRYADGRGSHDAVAGALRLLMSPAHRRLYGGLLCTIDLDNDPVETYEELLAFEPPVIGFLLPHGTWSSPPPGRTADRTRTPYADWLIQIFDRWYGAPRQETDVRLLREIIYLLLGRESASEAVGLTPSSLVVVETDGGIEQLDALKVVEQGAPATGMNIVDHSFDAVLRHPGIVARQLGRAALSETCQSCDLARVCGAGLYPHRYREGSGYLNPSVYCPDLYRLIQHIRTRLQLDLQRRRQG
ncbi:FxsB family cyclophane-forming radical SAM/SPASM peptide maturase [Streptosporangium sp. CA-135522]|uniref:FxsB family cyclophane-forming radical SAM/SPASM peptide maturase n=1 Tax=Streptosporangium sp. CA-135522 TaxID=3240072 RepID=UPI003D8E188D